MKFYPTLILLVFFCFPTIAQKYSDTEFVSPLDIPMKLSGTFGELRSNHFHSGIDIKTGEREGLNVYSIEKGYISRIKIQAGGYGKALYITHPGGYVSVYGHLSKYNTKINDYVVRSQYKHKSYELDLYPQAGEFPVEQGDIIAYSGNTGRSGGPHLHFEIRQLDGQKPINPLLFNYEVRDLTTPVINVLKVYPLGPLSSVEGSGSAKDYYTVVKSGHYVPKSGDTIKAAGSIYFGINTYDPFNGGMNKNGVYSIRLFVDDKEVYGHSLNLFSFDETRYINSLIDYAEYKEKSRRVQKTLVDPNNKLGIYTTKNYKGLQLEANRAYPVRFEVADIAGNTAVLKFWIKGLSSTRSENKKGTKDNLVAFSYLHDNSFVKDDIRLFVPGKALYSDFEFDYSKTATPSGAYSPMHHVHNESVPLHTWCSLSLRADNLPEKLRSKALLAKKQKGNVYSSQGGKFDKGFITTRIRNFGDYCIMVDTIAPSIRPVNIKNGKSLLAQTTIRVKIEDKLAGIDSYNAFLGEEWIMMEYDAKNDLLIYRFDHKLKDGENHFKLIVKDNVGNTAEYKAKLNY